MKNNFDWFFNIEKPTKTHIITLNNKKGYITTLCGLVIEYTIGDNNKKFRCKKCLKFKNK